MSATPDVRLTHGAERAPVDAPAREVAPEPRAATRTPRLAAVSWRHWFREVAVIAAGALAALAGQAWWQDRQDRERERDYLRNLLADTRANEARLNHAIITGTYSALLTTGDLRLIRDDALRGQLVAYAARVDGVVVGLRFYTEQAFGDAGRLVRAFPFVRGMFLHDEARVRADARRFPFARLRDNPDATAAMFAVQAANTNRVNHLRDATRALRRALEAQRAGNVGAGRDSAPKPPK